MSVITFPLERCRRTTRQKGGDSGYDQGFLEQLRGPLDEAAIDAACKEFERLRDERARKLRDHLNWDFKP